MIGKKSGQRRLSQVRARELTRNEEGMKEE
jgi:hypothetical protein